MLERIMLLSRPEPAKKKGNRLLHRVISASGALPFSARDTKRRNSFWTAPITPCLLLLLRASAKISLKGLLYFFRSRSAFTCQIWETRPIRHPLKTAVNCWSPGRVLTVLLTCVSSCSLVYSNEYLRLNPDAAPRVTPFEASPHENFEETREHIPALTPIPKSPTLHQLVEGHSCQVWRQPSPSPVMEFKISFPKRHQHQAARECTLILASNSILFLMVGGLAI